MVKLKHKKLGTREFEDEHAARLLKIPNNGGWEPVKKAKNEDRKEQDSGYN
jgi:hypothetical protein